MYKVAIHFFSGKKEFRSLSNFWEREVVVDGHTYESGEHAFHGEKYRLLSEDCEPERKQQLFEYSQTFMKPSLYKTGASVKRMGGKKGMPLSPEELSKWYILSLEVQRNICRWKLEHEEEVRQDLKKSGTQLLIHPALRCSEEKVKERIWEGRCVIVDGNPVVLGQNRLGQIWMDLR
jgi:predicted NAD-dependent protein-ADP-ribosyltransferase YbiA (DUF1768 family)